MKMFKLGLFFMMLYMLVPPSLLADFELTAPKRVQATRGSCVVIPCSYEKPSSQVINALWKKGSESMVVAASQPGYQVHSEYQKRTRFTGQVEKQDCSWMMWGVKKEDAGTYFFRIELPKYGGYSWVKKSVQITVVDPQPPPVMQVTPLRVGQDLLIVCSVVHSCPVRPPALTWSPTATHISSHSQKISDTEWVVVSQALVRTRQGQPQELRCAANYYGRLVYSKVQKV